MRVLANAALAFAAGVTCGLAAPAAAQNPPLVKNQALMDNTRYCSSLVNSLLRSYEAKGEKQPERLQLFSLGFASRLTGFPPEVKITKSWDELKAITDKQLADQPDVVRARIKICWERLSGEPAPGDLFQQ